MHTFGIECYGLSHEKRGKLDERGASGIFVGYSRKSPAYLVYHPQMRVVRDYRCVKFFDSPSKRLKGDDSGNPRIDEEKLEQGEISLDCTDEQEKLTGETKAGEKEKHYPTRNHRQPTYLEDYQIDECNLNVDCCYQVAMGVPLSSEQAMHSDNKRLQRTPMYNIVQETHET
ncbi:hypothetical protein CAPTEDRAFT_192227 [Capitella teleta]|uniref:Retroviral polymerase SH3-like domain-containing protein n=1 Tax=Capitella teleta TaxID=283909 RepID=R7U6T0_CAPTE|nr:hypothetical protein CAPTEDRAFT_192227 [Capitella teleta]|eukprot:ELT98820.1 hypothetical protein CAPTEDRAFT_192227 [Capitella teleta]